MPSTESAAAAALELDLAGLKCPLPVLKIGAALDRLAPGQSLVAITTDPLAAIDVPNLVNQRGDRLISVRQRDAATAFVIEKA